MSAGCAHCLPHHLHDGSSCQEEHAQSESSSGSRIGAELKERRLYKRATAMRHQARNRNATSSQVTTDHRDVCSECNAPGASTAVLRGALSIVQAVYGLCEYVNQIILSLYCKRNDNIFEPAPKGLLRGYFVRGTCTAGGRCYARVAVHSACERCGERHSYVAIKTRII